jgi:hypothetical protein
MRRAPILGRHFLRRCFGFRFVAVDCGKARSLSAGARAPGTDPKVHSH